MITFGEIPASRFDMVVQHYPEIVVPAKRLTTQKVPGRFGGDIVTWDGSYENYEQSYTVYIGAEDEANLPAKMQQIGEWLLNNPGYIGPNGVYRKFVDDRYPGYFRWAYYSGPSEMSSVFNEHGIGKLSFTFAPERYLTRNNMGSWVSLNPEIQEHGSGSTATINYTNPTGYSAYPFFRISGTKDAIVTIYKTNSDSVDTIQIGPLPSAAVYYLDSAYHCLRRSHAYNGTRFEWYKNISRVTGNYEDMKIEAGETGTITMVSDKPISEFIIAPRWWTL